MSSGTARVPPAQPPMVVSGRLLYPSLNALPSHDSGHLACKAPSPAPFLPFGPVSVTGLPLPVPLCV